MCAGKIGKPNGRCACVLPESNHQSPSNRADLPTTCKNKPVFCTRLIFPRENDIIKFIGGENVAANYNKLWRILVDRKLKRIDLRELAGISTTTVAKLGKDEYISMECMERICTALKCYIGDIMSFSR